jgi:predicted acylesterase/phospholipase RssA
MRGLYTAAVLEGLEERAGRPLRECFDLIAGTSVGGILALGLALGRPAGWIRAAVEAHGPRLFPCHGRGLRRLRGLFRSRYDAAPLAALVEQVLGAERRLADLEVPVLVPALSLTNGGAQLFRTPHHAAHRAQAGTRLVDVALSTSAAPGIFPLARIGSTEYLDGGTIANAPDAIALAEAGRFFGKRASDVFMLAVGTTTDLTALAAGGPVSRGLLYWLRRGRIAELYMSGQQHLAGQLVEEALGRRYLPLNTARSRPQAAVIALDRADPVALTTLKAMAAHALQECAGDERLHQFLGHEPDSIRGPWSP